MAPELQTAGQHGCNATEQKQHWGSSERNSVGLGNLSFTQRQDTATSILAVPPLLPCSHWVPKAPCTSKGVQRNPPLMTAHPSAHVSNGDMCKLHCIQRPRNSPKFGKNSRHAPGTTATPLHNSDPFFPSRAGGHCGFHAACWGLCFVSNTAKPTFLTISRLDAAQQFLLELVFLFFFLIHPEVKTHHEMETFSSNKCKKVSKLQANGKRIELRGAGQV